MNKRNYFSFATGNVFREGSLQQKQVRRPAMHYLIIAFEEKALSLMNGINSIQSFHSSKLFQRK